MTKFDNKFLEETISKSLSDPENFHVPKGISRYDYSDQHGWWVRIRRDDAPFQKFFWDHQFSTIGDCLKAAIEYRHEILETFPLEKKRKGKFRTLADEPENRISRRQDKGRLQPYVYWHATWYDENHNVKTKNFSVKKFGEEQAKELALEASSINHNKNPKPKKDLKIIDPYEKQTFKTLSREDVKLLSTINSGRYNKNDLSSKKEDIVNGSYPFGFEGNKVLQKHYTIERDRKLRDAKIREFLKTNDDIFCELCSFNFVDTYPFLSKNIIEVHHIIPLFQLPKKTKVRLEDLILLCANCHLAIHQGNEKKNLIFAMDYFKKQ